MHTYIHIYSTHRVVWQSLQQPTFHNFARNKQITACFKHTKTTLLLKWWQNPYMIHGRCLRADDPLRASGVWLWVWLSRGSPCQGVCLTANTRVVLPEAGPQETTVAGAVSAWRVGTTLHSPQNGGSAKGGPIMKSPTPNLPTNIVDFWGFDSSVIVILRGGILRYIGNFPESLSQSILVGVMLVGRLGLNATFAWPKRCLSASQVPCLGSPLGGRCIYTNTNTNTTNLT